jgi:D-cysteine desulfhydrase
MFPWRVGVEPLLILRKPATQLRFRECRPAGPLAPWAMKSRRVRSDSVTSNRRCLLLNRGPSPVRRLDPLSDAQCELWVKDDGSLHPLYGGNKIRKLEYLLGAIVERHPRRIVTVGSASSHHVLATSIMARQIGVPVVAVLCPHPRSDHAERVLKAILACGAHVRPARSMAAIPLEVARTLRRGDVVIGPGGSTVRGCLGYMDAVAELREQIRAGLVPEPDVIAVALGSGGTAAGLLAGVLQCGLRSKVAGIVVVGSSLAARVQTTQLAARLLIRQGHASHCRHLGRRLVVVTNQLGRGYGFATPSGIAATAKAAQVGLGLDPTYTAKAFAGALELAQAARCSSRSAGKHNPGLFASASEVPARVLYWHTLSSVMPAPGATPGSGHSADCRAHLMDRLLVPDFGA